MLHRRKTAGMAITPPIASSMAARTERRKSALSSARSSAICCLTSSWASATMPLTRAVTVCPSGGGTVSVAIGSAPQGPADHETDADAHQQGGDRVATDDAGHVVGHVAEAVFLEVAAAGFPRFFGVFAGLVDNVLAGADGPGSPI